MPFCSTISLYSRIVLHILFINLLEDSIPASVQKMSLSGGESERTNHLAVSAPYSLIISSGSTIFFFDFDIFSEGPTFIFSPVSLWWASCLLSPFLTNFGSIQSPFSLEYVS